MQDFQLLLCQLPIQCMHACHFCQKPQLTSPGSKQCYLGQFFLIANLASKKELDLFWPHFKSAMASPIAIQFLMIIGGWWLWVKTWLLLQDLLSMYWNWTKCKSYPCTEGNFALTLKIGYEHASDRGTHACTYSKRAKWKNLSMQTVVNHKFASTSNCLIPKCIFFEAKKHNPQVVQQQDIKNNEGILVLNKYQAGEFVSMDQFVVSTPWQFLTGWR